MRAVQREFLRNAIASAMDLEVGWGNNLESSGMKNANVFVDVDLTLVDGDGRILAGAVEGLKALREAGCHLFLWSSCGAEYCRKVAEGNRIAELFEGFSAKPDIVIDDMPGTCVAPFVFNVQEKGASWDGVVKEILERHVD